MEQSDIQKFKSQLERLKEEIERRIKEAYETADFGEGLDDDETHETEAFINQMSVAQVLKNRLAEVEHALKKFDTNQYGFCERCGKEIPAEILTLVPESRWCKECKVLAK